MTKYYIKVIKSDCKFCNKISKNANSAAQHQIRCKLNPDRLQLINDPNRGYKDGTRVGWSKGQTKFTNASVAQIGKTYSVKYKLGLIIRSHKHTEKTKDHLSKVRKEYLLKNPDKVPYLLNHSSKRSYPEIYFTEIFVDKYPNISIEHKVGTYSLDFAFPEFKIGIEIDGEQHYLDKKVVASDIRRKEYLDKYGWEILRIRWSHYQKLNFDQKQQLLEKIFTRVGVGTQGGLISLSAPD